MCVHQAIVNQSGSFKNRKQSDKQTRDLSVHSHSFVVLANPIQKSAQIVQNGIFPCTQSFVLVHGKIGTGGHLITVYIY